MANWSSAARMSRYPVNGTSAKGGRKKMMRPYNILIVDDSGTTRAMIKRVIQMAELPIKSLFEAPDGSVALQLLVAHHGTGAAIDLVLTDLNMPVMDGLEMTRQIR